MNGRRMTRFSLPMLLFSLHCNSNKPDAASSQKADERVAEAVPSNRVDVSQTVRRNLGISFARVESRAVAQTLRVPGQFELLPQARREYRTMLAGRVELQVRQFDTVLPGTSLFRLVSPEWRDLQQKMNEAVAAIRQAEARVASIPSQLAAHHNHEEILRSGVALWEKRGKQVEQSQASGVVTIDELTNIQNSLVTKQADLAEVLEREAELEAQSATARADHDAAHARFRLLLSTASTLLGTDEKTLSAPYDLDQHMHTGPNVEPKHGTEAALPTAHWRDIGQIEVKATTPGIVETVDLTNGAWAATGSLVVTTIEPLLLRFRARGMQSDLGLLRDGLPARIVPPTGGASGLGESMDAALSLGLVANAQERTIELIAVPARNAPWARAGVSAHLEIVTAGGQPELAIPLSSVIQDGLQKFIFRRDPANPDKVIRMEADLGVNDGRWIVVNSGVMEGDEVVLDGVYQLMIATSGTVEKGGHFHADGSFHAEKDK